MTGPRGKPLTQSSHTRGMGDNTYATAVRDISEGFDQIEAAVAAVRRSTSVWTVPDLTIRSIEIPTVNTKAFEQAGVAVRDLLRAIDESVPANIRGASITDRAADLMLDEGLPLWGIPQRDVVLELIGAADGEVRLRILPRRPVEVLGHCAELLSGRSSRWAELCNLVVEALRDGHPEAAQCLATNVVDGILSELFPSSGEAVEFAKEPYGDKPIRVTGHYLVLRPVVLAFTKWRPSWGTPPPDRYSRHVTTHRPAAEGVFEPPRPLIATMLASTLAAGFFE